MEMALKLFAFWYSMGLILAVREEYRMWKRGHDIKVKNIKSMLLISLAGLLLWIEVIGEIGEAIYKLGEMTVIKGKKKADGK